MIAGWSTYSLKDFLLFGPETYWRLFALENQDQWPVALVTLAAGLGLVAALVRGWQPSGRLIGPLAGLIWLWVGWQFVFQRYGPINWVTEDLSILFYTQGLLLAGLGISGKLRLFRTGERHAKAASAVLFAIALAIYPLLALFDGRAWQTAQVLGVAPDPTVVATLGLLVLAPRRWPAAILQIAPALWLGISAMTLLAMDAWQGWFTLSVWLAGFTAWLAIPARMRGPTP